MSGTNSMSRWAQVGATIADMAPMLGTIVGGPAGTAVGALIASTLGTANNPEAVMAKLRSDPEAALKLKQLEADERGNIRAHILGMAQAEMADQQQARSTHKDHWMPAVLTFMLTIMAGMTTWGVFSYPVPDSSKEVAFFIVGQIMTAFVTAVAFWLGSSRSSQVAQRVIREDMMK